MHQQDQQKKTQTEVDFFSDYGDANRYKIQEIVGKGSYGVVCSAIDTHTGQKVAIKKIHDIFENVSNAARILREIKLLRLLRHPDIVEIKHIMLPPSRKDFKDVYVVFELMDADLHHVIKANDDLTPEHCQFFLYQMLRALKYIHTANVFHRDLKPNNILANADCKLKICDFGLARVAFGDAPTAIFWTDYIATRWFRAPELCGSFFSKYTPAIDIWSIGCIFAQVLTGKPLFPGKNCAHQLDLMTDLLGTPSPDTISRVRNEKARRYLTSMGKKLPVEFAQKFPNADPRALKLLERLLAFDPRDRPTAEEALADPYFEGLAKVEREPSCRPISKLEFEFEMRRATKEDIRELIFREILEYHPQLLKDYTNGTESTKFLYPSAVHQFRKQFAHLEQNGPVIPLERRHNSLPRSTVIHSSPIVPLKDGQNQGNLQTQQRIPMAKPGNVAGNNTNDAYDPRAYVRNAALPLHAIPPPYHVPRTNVTKQQLPQHNTAYDPRAYVRNAVLPLHAIPPPYHVGRTNVRKHPDRDLPQNRQQPPQCNTMGILTPDVAIDIESSYLLRAAGVSKSDQGMDQIAVVAHREISVWCCS